MYWLKRLHSTHINYKQLKMNGIPYKALQLFLFHCSSCSHVLYPAMYVLLNMISVKVP